MGSENIERIDLGDGNWWDIRTVVTRGMRKQFRKASLMGIASKLRNGHQVDASNTDELKKQIMSHPEDWNLDAIDDAYLLGGTVAYSFGDTVNLETIDSLPDDVVVKVLDRMKELYQGLSEKEKADFFGTPSQPTTVTGN